MLRCAIVEDSPRELEHLKECLARYSAERDIPLDDKAFRYWNVKTDRWEPEGGSNQQQEAASVPDLRLRAEVSVQGTGAPDPYAGKAVQCYRTADIKNVPDAAFEALLGHAIPEDKPHIDQTMTLGELNHSRSPLCWLAWAVLHTLLKRSSREGTPDLTLLFQYNMPVRALAKLPGGLLGQEAVDGIVMEAKGFWIIGLLRVAYEAIKTVILNAQLEKLAKKLGSNYAANTSASADRMPCVKAFSLLKRFMRSQLTFTDAMTMVNY